MLKGRLIVLVVLGTCGLCRDIGAADKSGVGPNSISLPKGPGSVEGLGESFQPTLNTGTAKYGIALKFPAGTGGQTPGLSLSYEGGEGSGPLGFGWQLGLPHIQRRTDRGIPTYGEVLGVSRDDAFINDAKEELVPDTAGFWFCKNEGAFVRYRYLNNRWEGTLPDGSQLRFGAGDNSLVHDADARVFRWLLEQETDTHGNTIVYQYTNFPGIQNTNQLYVQEIRYGPGAPPWERFHFVRFEYEPRADWVEDCRAGFAIRTGMRLTNIVIGTQGASLVGHAQGDFNGDGVADSLVRAYRLEYLTNSYWSLLSRVTAVGADGVSTLPPATFGYQVCDPPREVSARDQDLGSLQEPGHVMDNKSVDFIDLNGEGLPDILYTDLAGGTHQAYLNQGEKRVDQYRAIQWSEPVAMASKDGLALQVDLRSNDAHLADMDGDGLADLVYKPRLDAVEYYPNRRNAAWGLRTAMTLAGEAPPSPFGEQTVRTADLDFDKRMDIIQSVPRGDDGQADYRIWFNLGNGTYSAPTTVSQVNGVVFSPTVHLADFNGDRVPDLVEVTLTDVVLRVGLGYGRFAPPERINFPDEISISEEQRDNARLVDITGDGLADVVLEPDTSGRLYYWINLGNHALGPLKVVSGMPARMGAYAVVRWADLNGNGTTDFVLADSDSTPQLRTVDLGELIGCYPAPNTLLAITNGIGRVTLIGYEPSTKFALEDAAAGQPWPDPMPFPVSVVASVTNLDSLGHQYFSRFRYHNGYYDPVEKQFRGFAKVEQVDEGDASAPSLVTRSHFDTGRDFEVMKGKLLRLTAEQANGLVFTDESNAWTVPPITLFTGTNGQAVAYAHPTANLKLIKELGVGEERRLETEFAYDRFGNKTREADYGIVTNDDRSAFNDQRITTTEYAINTNAWILHLPARQEVTDENGIAVSRTDFFYDDETFAGDNRGLVTLGNLTMKRDWVWPGSQTNTATIAAARTKYDGYGNPIVILDPLAAAPGGAVNFTNGHAREIAYDTRFHTFPITETIHLGDDNAPLVFQAAYDEGFGTVTSSTDFNGNQTAYGYDAFARLTSIVKPGDTTDHPTVEYEYALALPFRETNLVNFVETRQLDKDPAAAGSKRDHYFLSRQFVDGLGRKLLTKTEAEAAPDSTAPRVVVTEATVFNARQKPDRVLNPFFSLQGGALDELLGFEDIQAPDWHGQFHNEGLLVALDLASAHSTRTDYDATLRPIQITNPDGTFRRTVYEPLLTRSFDENQTNLLGPCMIHENDGLGRLVQVREVVRLTDEGQAGVLTEWLTRYEYDLNDQLTHLTDSQNNEKWFAYDGLKRKTFMNDPDRGVMHFVYDDASNLSETTDAKGQRISYTYDGANRIRTEKYLDGQAPPPWRAGAEGLTNSVVYHYDAPVANLPQGDNTLATAQNVKGALAWVEDLSGEEHTSYDARGRVAWVVKRIPDLVTLTAVPDHPSLVSYRTAFTYDSLDRLTTLVYPDADLLRYEYGDRNLLRRIPGGPGGSIIADVAYPPSAQLGRIDYGNGVRTSYAYDSRLRLRDLHTFSASGGEAGNGLDLIHFAYEFDGVSNMKAIEDRRPGSAVPEGDPRRNTQIFQYDDLYRLTQVQYSFELPGQTRRNDGIIDYRYDRIGNMLAQTSTLTNHVEKGLPVADLGQMDSGGAVGRWGRKGRTPDDPPGPHALTRISNPRTAAAQRDYGYDANGNMTEIDGQACTWDFKDRLVAVENAEMRAAYAYDYTDRRIAKNVAYKPGSANATNHDAKITTLYINKYFEVREHDAPTKYVWNGNTRVARVTGSLTTNMRVQRLRVWPGWNLRSLAVTATNLLQQFGSAFSLQPSAFRWKPSAQAWIKVTSNDTLPAGTVLWLKASTNATLTITGSYSDPTNRTVPAGGDFLPSANLEAWDFKAAISNLPFASAWTYDALSTRWLSCLPPPLGLQSDLPAFIAPGEAVFVRADAPVQLQVPDSAPRIRYYHQDHLGSSTVVADQNSSVVEERSTYPFGATRLVKEGVHPHEPYGFTQKELDTESALHYFNARYVYCPISRFMSMDRVLINSQIHARASLQQLHGYSYVENRPTCFTDDSGRWSSKRYGDGGNVHAKVTEAIARKSGGFSGAEIKLLTVAASETADSDKYANIAYRHAMTDSTTALPDSVRTEVNSFIQKQVALAIDDYMKGDIKSSMENLGFAIHAGQDSMSPAHSFGYWYGGGNAALVVGYVVPSANEYGRHLSAEGFDPTANSSTGEITKRIMDAYINGVKAGSGVNNVNFMQGLQADKKPAADPVPPHVYGDADIWY